MCEFGALEKKIKNILKMYMLVEFVRRGVVFRINYNTRRIATKYSDVGATGATIFYIKKKKTPKSD